MANPFQPLKNPPKAAPSNMYNSDDDKFIIEYELKNTYKKIGDDPKNDTDYKVDTIVVESSRTNRNDYINSFKNEVGIMNVLEKVRMTGDATLLDQTKRSPVPSVKTGKGNLEEIVDVSNIPDSFINADQSIMKGHQLFEKLPKELKGKLSFEDFVAKSADLYEKYVNDIVAKSQAGTTESEGK